jgi:hypothetical protein
MFRAFKRSLSGSHGDVALWAQLPVVRISDTCGARLKSNARESTVYEIVNNADGAIAPSCLTALASFLTVAQDPEAVVLQFSEMFDDVLNAVPRVRPVRCCSNTPDWSARNSNARLR